MLRLLWFACIAATCWFAFIPAEWGGLGGEGYHGLAFFVLGLLTPAAFPRLPVLVVWIVLIVLGGGIELAQEYLFDTLRHGEWADFRVDAAAAAAGVLSALLVRQLAKRYHGKAEAEPLDAGSEA